MKFNKIAKFYLTADIESEDIDKETSYLNSLIKNVKKKDQNTDDLLKFIKTGIVILGEIKQECSFLNGFPSIKLNNSIINNKSLLESIVHLGKTLFGSDFTFSQNTGETRVIIKNEDMAFEHLNTVEQHLEKIQQNHQDFSKLNKNLMIFTLELREVMTGLKRYTSLKSLIDRVS